MMDVVLAAYDLEESIRIEGGLRLVMLPFVKKAIKMLLHDDKDKAMEYLKLARKVERLNQEVPDWYEAVMMSRFGPQPFHGFLDNDEDEDDQDCHSCGRKETCDEEHVLERRDHDRHTYGQHEDRCKLKRREICDEEGRDREETCAKEHGIKTKDQGIRGCSREERNNEERGLKMEDRSRM